MAVSDSSRLVARKLACAGTWPIGDRPIGDATRPAQYSEGGRVFPVGGGAFAGRRSLKAGLQQWNRPAAIYRGAKRRASSSGVAQAGFCLAVVAWLMLMGGGCSSPLIRSQSPEAGEAEGAAASDAPPAALVGDLAGPWGLSYLKVESVALVTGLAGTGSDPRPSYLRDRLIDEMQTHSVEHPHEVLGSRNTAMVLVRGYLPPGIQKGDHFDVQVLVPPRSDTKSLRGGWLMQSRLRRMEVLGNSVQTSHVAALAGGRVLDEGVFAEGDPENRQLRGQVLGGGTVLVSRPLGLVIREGSHSVLTTSLIAGALNSRFHTYDRGTKVGVATGKNDKFIELVVEPRYKHNLARYIRVVLSLPIQETPDQRLKRLELLKRQLLDPTTAALAALRLEAIGDEAIDVLLEGISDEDVEVRFYAAEALAYLDADAAADPLAEIAENEPAFRWHALTALAAMDHVHAYESLSRLLDVSSAETRYGAFRALRARNPADPLVRGETLADEFSYHLLTTNGDPMVHLSATNRPEIVVFGHQQKLKSPNVLFAGKEIMLKRVDDEHVKLSRFSPGEPDRYEVCSNSLDDVIHAIVKLGGRYAELAQFLTDAKKSKYLTARLAINALPTPGRQFHRDDSDTLVAARSDRPAFHVANPLPDLFHPGARAEPASDEPEPVAPPPVDEEPSTSGGFFGKMTHWFSS